MGFPYKHTYSEAVTQCQTGLSTSFVTKTGVFAKHQYFKFIVHNKHTYSEAVTQCQTGLSTSFVTKTGFLAKHQYFKFIVHNISMRKRSLEQSTYNVRLQLGDD